MAGSSARSNSSMRVSSRDDLFFALEEDIHHRELVGLALPPQPPGLRERLTGTRELSLSRVCLINDMASARAVARR